MMFEEGRQRFFFEKKAPRPGKQKTFAPAGVGTCRARARSEQKFFCCFFFKKRSACFLESTP
jgi:hypothetical protein